MISNDPDVSAAVVDASVWCDALLPGSRRDAARAALEPYTVVIAPEHTLLEIAQVLRRYARTDLGNVRATAIVRTLRALALDIVPTVDLLSRIWELRDGLTCYDAAYLAAGEHRRAPLLTRDAALLAYADRARCPVIAVG
jgi:predicted nucleic acid-binding protein